MQSCRVPQEEYSNLFRDVRLLGGIQNRENRDTQNINVSGKEVGRKSSNSQMNWAGGANVWPQEWNKP